VTCIHEANSNQVDQHFDGTVERKRMKKDLREGQKSKAHNRILLLFGAILSGLFLLTIMNEVLDIPHYLLGDAPTSLEQRKGEVIMEMIIYAAVVFVSFGYYNRLQKRINILEGILPICSNCKKIRQDQDWIVLEEYIRSHSLADFTHGLCPECIRKLYPDQADAILSKLKARGVR
jgi:hypothetical protein